MAQALPFIMAGLTAATMYSQLKGGQQQAKGLMRQAAFRKVQARSEALKYRQQGAAVMDNILATKASINARIAAGGLETFSGSAKVLGVMAEAKGANELFLTRDGEQIAFGTGEAQAMQYASQAKSAMAAGRTAALGTLTTAIAGQMALGGAPGGGGGTGLEAGQSATVSRAGFRGYGG